MSIEYIAVRCFSDQCQIFQVIQKTKVNKFTCKICNNKQSIRKIYAQSYKAKDVREIVQNLNRKEIEKKNHVDIPSDANIQEESQNKRVYYENEEDEDTTIFNNDSTFESRWAKYMPTNNSNNDDCDEDADDVITSMPDDNKKRKKDSKIHSKSFNKN